MTSLRWLFLLAVLAVLAVLGVLLHPSEILAQGKSRNAVHIQVYVRYSDGTSAGTGVFVELGLENGEMVDQIQTDSSGRCQFSPGTGPAVYLVRAKQPGYQEARIRLDLQNTQSGLANFVLKPIPGQTPPALSNGATGSTVSAVDLSVPEPARKEYGLAQEALQKRDLDAGIAHLKKAVELHDQFPNAYVLLGTVLNEQKKWKEAQAALEKAVQLDPKATEALFQLGSALNQQKDYAGAEKAFTKGLELKPDAPTAPMAHYELARAYMGLGQWQNAEPHAAKAIAGQADFAMGHVLMGNIDLKKGDGPAAINEFQAYLKLEPNGPSAASVRDMIPKIQAAMQKK
jgi:tetratricopeptide (TPR) repeat protein